MSLLAWVAVGLIAGLLGSKVVNRRGKGVFLDVVLGIVGALAGGYLFTFVGHAPVTGSNLYSMFAATAGAVLVLLVNHGLRRGLADRVT
jgi:uncharacterized membrane protein YeaQ/YmgE (transglycosylase-associated protein family)